MLPLRDREVCSCYLDVPRTVLKNSSFAHKYSTVAGKKPPKDLNDIPDASDPLEAYQTRPRTGTFADK